MARGDYLQERQAHQAFLLKHQADDWIYKYILNEEDEGSCSTPLA
jgi:hypothetical protein